MTYLDLYLKSDVLIIKNSGKYLDLHLDEDDQTLDFLYDDGSLFASYPYTEDIQEVGLDFVVVNDLVLYLFKMTTVINDLNEK